MELELTNPMVYAVPCFVAFILMEIVHWKKRGPNDTYNLKDLKASSIIALGTAILGPLAKITYITWLFVTVYEVFNPMVNGVRMNIFGYQSFGYEWYFWVLCQLGDDITFYWFHRLSHTIRFFWAAHIPHHSSEYFNYGTGIRISWFTLVNKPFFYIWLMAIGFHVEMVIICLAIETIYQFQLHTKLVPKLGVLEKILVTHTQHQVHHGKNIEYLDKNHGGILSIWDRLFGSFREYDEKIKIEYGILNKELSFNPIQIITHEYQSIWEDVKSSKNLTEAFKYVFGPPGWSPDGSRKTARELQNELKLEQVKTTSN
ncbi:MAG: sterol desaturase family protein [Cyclobacteriaceae bacterium]|nr:sterol desaturase family protein [Cyclobacteriaceae bacterium]